MAEGISAETLFEEGFAGSEFRDVDPIFTCVCVHIYCVGWFQ